MNLLAPIRKHLVRSGRTLAAIALIAATTEQAQATTVGLGMAKDFAVLALNGSHVCMVTGTINNGDFGIGPNSYAYLVGNTVNGSLLIDTTSAANVTIEPTLSVAGYKMTVDLAPPNSDAAMASASFAALPVNRPDVTVLNSTQTITGNGGDNVFSITSVSMTLNTLTLSGTANDYFIFNVTGDLDFLASNIVLNGGVIPNHVIFNVIGALPGNSVLLAGSGTTFRGTVLAPDRAIQAGGLMVLGALIGGRDSSFDDVTPIGASMSITGATIGRLPFEPTPSAGCISIDKTVSPATGDAGDPVTYTLTVRNCGTVDLTVASIVDTLLGNITAAFVTDHGSNVLAAGTSDSFTVNSNIPGDKGNPVTNVATVTAQANGTSYVDSDDATVAIPVSISGGAYNDVICNGVLDPGDTPLPGATFVLSDMNGGPVNDLGGNPVTAQVGSTFSFTNLGPGIYKVTEINPPGYTSTNAIPGVGGTKLTNDVIEVNATGSIFDFPGQTFLDGDCIELLYQAYPGNSGDTNRSFAGYAGSMADNTTSVPGVLQIIPQDNGEPAWANFIENPATETLSSVTLVKVMPAFNPCSAVFPGDVVMQQGSANIRLWWPLMYELPGTTWTLSVQTDVNTNTWKWQVDATLQSLKDTLQLFREVAFDRGQVPLVSDEVLYPVLQAKLDAAGAAIGDGDLGLAGRILDDFVTEVNDAWISTTPMYPNPTGPETGITQTVENPTACKLMSDALYVEDKLGL